MAFYSGIAHALGNLFGGDDDEDKKKKQQAQRKSAPQKAVVVRPVGDQGSSGTDDNQSAAPPSSIFSSNTPLQKANPKGPKTVLGAPAFDPNALVKAKPKLAAAPDPEPEKKPGASIWHNITHNPVTDVVGGAAKATGSVAAGASLATLRAGEGLVTSTAAIPSMAVHSADWIGQKIAGGKRVSNPIVENVDKITKKITAPVDFLSKKTDEAINAFGPQGKAIYKPAQVAANVATVVPGATAVLSKVAGQGSKLARVNDLVQGQRAIPTLRKAVAGRAATPELAPGLKSTNPTQADDAVKQIKEQEIAANPPAPLEPPAGVSDTPAYMRRAQPKATPVPTAQDLYKADQSAARAEGSLPRQTYEAGLDPKNSVDAVPAFQRRGAVQPPEVQAKITDLQKQLDVMPSPESSQSVIFHLKRQYSNKLRSNPTQAAAIRQHLEEAINAVRQSADERAAVQAQLDDLTLGSVDTPSPPPAVPETVPAPVASVPEQVLPSADRPAGDIQLAIEQAHNAGDTAKVEELIGTLPEEMQAPMKVSLGLAAPRHPVVDPATGKITMVDEAAPSPPAPEAAPSGPPATPDLPTSGDTVPTAPRTHDALVKQMGDIGAGMKGKYGSRTAINLDDLKANADRVIANMGDDEVLAAFQSVGPELIAHDPQSLALARSALDRLAQHADNPAAVQAVSNIMDAMEKLSSKSGQVLRVIQEDFDKMPLPMKVRYVVKQIDRANVGTKNYAPLADDPAAAARVEGIITDYLQKSESINQRAAAIEGQLNEVADAAKSGQRSATDVGKTVKTLRDEQRSLAENNGELVKYYQTLMPKRSRGQRSNDFARRMMLGSFTGRVNDVLTTSNNVIHQALQNVTQGVLAKVVNAVKPGATVDTLRGVPEFARGTREGVRTGAGELGGKQYAGDLQKALKNNTGARTGLTKATGPVGRTIQAATEFATNASEGVKTQRIYQLAVKEAQQQGVPRELVADYARARAAVPTREMLRAGDELKAQVNNLNDNPVSHALNRVAAGIASDKPGVAGTVSGLIKNQIIPFTSWLGGNIYNSVTDKNVIAAFVKLAHSAGKGDVDGIVENLAKTANNAAYTYALGYLMTKNGLIVNHGPTDPSTGKAYNDAGAYIKLGDRYVRADFLGFFAPSIILGNAAYHGLNDNAKGSIAEKIGTFAGTTLTNSLLSTGTSQLGVENNAARSLTTATTGKDPGGGAAQFAGGAAGQFTPALGSDINAVLNNGLEVGGKTIVPDSLNPTHEAANTKVLKGGLTATGLPSKAKDVPKSAVASFKNRIPFASQNLPRKAGVAAPDLLDKVSRGARDTSASKETDKQAKIKVDQATDFKARGVPNPDEKGFDEKVKARFESGEYDQAIEGLQTKLKKQESNKDIPKSKNDDLKDQIKLYKVHKNGKFKPAYAELYQKTTLSEWRNMGDPESDEYDPRAYQRLYEYDTARAKSAISKSPLDGTRNAYTAKVKKAAKGKSASDAALKKITSNTIGSTPNLGNISFGDLAPQKVNSPKISTIQQVKSGELIKKRVISVGRGQG